MCLICGDRIDDGRATPSDGVAFDCAIHGAYTIARAALPRFTALKRDERRAVIERAKLFAPQRNNEILVTALDL